MGPIEKEGHSVAMHYRCKYTPPVTNIPFSWWRLIICPCSKWNIRWKRRKLAAR